MGNKSAKEFIEKARESDVIELDLSHKKIAELPESVGDLKSLIKVRRSALPTPAAQACSAPAETPFSLFFFFFLF